MRRYISELRVDDNIRGQREIFGRDVEAIAEQVLKHLTTYPELQRRVESRAQGRSPESRFARRLLAERRERDHLFGSELFGEPVWDILLDLFVAHHEHSRVSVSSLCVAAAVPPTTAHRWIHDMTRRGILVRRRDEMDGRRVWIELAPHMLEKMETLIARWMEASSN